MVTLLYSSNFFVVGDGIQLAPEVFKKAGNVQPVGESMVDVEGHRDLDPTVLLPVLAPGDPGMAVPRHTAGKLDLHVGEPGDAGDEEVVQDVSPFRQDALFDSGGLVGLALGAERADVGVPPSTST